MSPMSPRLLRPRQSLHPEALHPEAADWAARVTAAGATYSGTTLTAVSKFCRSIDAAGIRSKFLRLNLFCGNSITAALIPLYRSSAYGGAVVGNASDTNNNFVSADYVETGSDTGGLKGNGTNKDLETGINPVALSFSTSDHHLSVYVKGTEAAGTSRSMLANGTASPGSGLGWLNSGSTERFHGPSATINPSGTSQGFIVGNVSGSTYDYFRASTSVATFTGAGGGSHANNQYRVFSANGLLYSLQRYIRAYSIGLGFSGDQINAYYNAMQAFQTALGRQV